MPELRTTCSRCNTCFDWNSDRHEEMPDCPRCGFNPSTKFKRADVAELLEMLNSPDRYESSGAAAELGKRGDRTAVEPLIRALYREGPALAAAIALGKLQDDRAVDDLVTVAGIMVYKGREGQAEAAYEALAQIGTEKAVNALVALLPRMRLPAMQNVLSRLVALAQDIPLLHLEAGLFAALQNQHAPARQGAVWGLAKMWALHKGTVGCQIAIERLQPLLKDPEPGVVDFARRALADLGWRPSDPRLAAVFLARCELWDDLRALGPPGIENLRVTLLRGIKADTRSAAAKGLATLGWQPANDPERLAFLVARGELDKLPFTKPAVVKALLTALADETYPYRWKLPEALGKSGDASAVEPLLDLLATEKDGFRRGKVLEALGQLRDARALEPLLAALKDSDNDVRPAAAKGLGFLGNAAAVDPLIAALKDSYVGTRLYAAESLGALGERRAVKPLKALAQNASEKNHVRAAAAGAVEKISGKRPEVKTLASQQSVEGPGEASAPKHFTSFFCPGCGTEIVTKLETVGNCVTCPRCGKVVTVPEVGASLDPPRRQVGCVFAVFLVGAALVGGAIAGYHLLEDSAWRSILIWGGSIIGGFCFLGGFGGIHEAVNVRAPCKSCGEMSTWHLSCPHCSYTPLWAALGGLILSLGCLAGSIFFFLTNMLDGPQAGEPKWFTLAYVGVFVVAFAGVIGALVMFTLTVKCLLSLIWIRPASGLSRIIRAVLVLALLTSLPFLYFWGMEMEASHKRELMTQANEALPDFTFAHFQKQLPRLVGELNNAEKFAPPFFAITHTEPSLDSATKEGVWIRVPAGTSRLDEANTVLFIDTKLVAGKDSVHKEPPPPIKTKDGPPSSPDANPADKPIEPGPGQKKYTMTVCFIDRGSPERRRVVELHQIVPAMSDDPPPFRALLEKACAQAGRD